MKIMNFNTLSFLLYVPGAEFKYDVGDHNQNLQRYTNHDNDNNDNNDEVQHTAILIIIIIIKMVMV